MPAGLARGSELWASRLESWVGAKGHRIVLSASDSFPRRELLAMGHQPPDVLIVDKSPENREVLRTMLRRDGVRTVEAPDAVAGLVLAKSSHPRVLVLDTDTIDLSDPGVCDDFGDEANKEDCAIVVLGRIRRPNEALTPSEVVPKPYHYGPLIRRIEELLRHSDQQT